MVRDERPLTARDEDAERAPPTLRFDVKVEDAEDISPPEGLMENVVEEAMS